MIRWLRAWPLLLALVIGGCAGLKPVPTVPATPGVEATALDKAQAAVSEANVALTSINKAIASGVKAGTLAKADAQRLLDRSVALGVQVDRAQALIRAGDPGAGGQAELVRSLVLALYAEIRPILEKEATK